MDLLKTLNNELSHPEKRIGQIWITMTGLEFLITDVIDDKSVRATILINKPKDIDYYPNVLLSSIKYNFLPSDRIAVGKADGPIPVKVLETFLGSVNKQDVNEVRASYFYSIEDNVEFKPIVVDYIMQLHNMRMESFSHLF